MTIPKKYGAALVTFSCLLPLMAQDQQSPAAVLKPRVVALPTGTCGAVSEGDVVTLEWNPAFENQAVVTGLKNFSLTFARYGEESRARRGHGGLLLFAVPLRSAGMPVPNAITAGLGGFFQMSFRVGRAEPGEYHLVDATAEPLLVPEYSGKRPEMTNKPTASFFCIDVLPSVRPARGR